MIQPIPARGTRLLALAAVALLILAAPTSADVVLNNGDVFDVTPGAPVTADGLMGMRFNGGKPGSDLNFGAVGAYTENPDGTISQASRLLSNTPAIVALDDIALNMDREGAAAPAPGDGPFHWEAIFGVSTAGDQSDFQVGWTGEFSPDADGDFTFTSHDKNFTGTNVDDDASIFIDANQNGIFEASEGFQSGGGASVTVTGLLATQQYRIAIGFREGTGDEEVSYTFQGTAGAFTTETGINPGDAAQAGLWSSTFVPDTSIGDVTVNGDSTINLQSTVPSAVAGTLTFANTQDDPATLTVNSADTNQGLVFSGAATLNGNGAVFNLVNVPVVTLSDVGGPGSLTVTGDGTLTLVTTNTYGGATTVDGVVLEVAADNALGTTGAGTTINAGGSLALLGAVNTNDEPITIAGTGNSRSGGAINNVSGNSDDMTGLITLSGDAEIRNSANRMRLRGGIDLGSNDLTLRVNGGNLEIRDQPITGTGGIIKEGNSDLNVYNGPNHTFTGPVDIRDGQLDARGDSSLGDSVGGTTVRDGATLMVRDGRTLGDDIEITGTGHNNRGAIRNENNSNTLTGTITMSGNSRIHVNNTQLTLSGVLTESGGSRQLEKTGAGTLVLSNAGNSFSGETIISGGTVQADSVAALGNTPSASVASGAALLVSGDGTLNIPITVRGGTLGNPTAGTTLTLDGPIDLPLAADITFAGDGNIVVNQPFGNGVGPANGLMAMRFTVNTPADDLDYGAVGAYTVNPDDTISQDSRLLSNTPAIVAVQDIAMNMDREGAASPAPGDGPFHWQAVFGSSTAGDQDNFEVAWTGEFSPDADGDFTFTSHDKDFTGGNVDDDASFFIDANQDGVFQASEGFFSGSGASVTATGLLAGQKYRVAIGFHEGGGDEEVSYTFQGTAGAFTAETGINPGDPAQSGRFTANPVNNVIKKGAGTTTFAAPTNYNGDTTVEDGALVTTSNITVNESRKLQLGSGAAFTATTGAFEVGGTIDANKPETLVLGGAGSLMTVSTTPVPVGHPTNGLLGLWTFDDGTARDLSGNGHNGTFVGSPTISSADLYDPGAGMSLDTNGGNNAILVGGDEADFDTGDQLTVVGWVKERPDSNWEPYISKRGESGQGWQVRRRSSSSNFSFTLRGPSGDDDPQGTFDLGDNNGSGGWIHFVARTDLTTNQLTQLIVNGNTAAPDITQVDTGTINDTGSSVVFGARDNSGNAGNPADIGNWAHIKLDDVFIYDRWLTDAEIAALYNGGVALPRAFTLTAAVDNLQGSGAIDTTASAGLEITGSLDIGAGIGQIDVMGDLILGDGITIDWEYSNGTADRDLVTITGDLELPSMATLNVTNLLGTGELQPTEILFDAGSLSGATDLSGWTVAGAPDSAVAILGNDVVLSTATAAVPEPSTLALAALGLLGLAFFARRRAL